MTRAPACILIPAYRPGREFVPLVQALDARGFVVVVVDDGSGPEFAERFAAAGALPHVTVLTHAVNLGKGAALKTGLNRILCDHPDATIITADADGQHHPDDIARVAAAAAEQPQRLLLGVREFRANVPLRSRFGNTATRVLFRVLAGQRLTDTQTGLRAIPASLAARLLRLESTGYEFELDMLVTARQLGVATAEVPIRTIYLDGNASSHFNPVLDSMRIYFVLLRFSAIALVTALVDNLVFLSVFRTGSSILLAQVAGRLIALGVNYVGLRRAVFFSRESHRQILPKYLLLVAGSGVVSYGLIRLLTQSAGFSPITAKLVAEGALFIANFTIQRDFVFTVRSPTTGATDWDRYYKSVPPTARLTRRYTTGALLGALRDTRLFGDGAPRTIVEIGGANSCFLDPILAACRPATYHIVDSNRLGLDLLRSRQDAGTRIQLHEQDVLALTLDTRADVVFSVGLVEHFDVRRTRDAVRAHLRLVRPGGFAIISFPTPTWLYRATRSAIEAAGMWKFPDERPLARDEVAAAAGDDVRLVTERTLWPLMLTQHLMVFQKPAEPGRA